MTVTKDALKSRNPGRKEIQSLQSLKQTAQFAPAKLNPVYGRFSKGGRNEASETFYHLNAIVIVYFEFWNFRIYCK